MSDLLCFVFFDVFMKCPASFTDMSAILQAHLFIEDPIIFEFL